MTTTEHYPSPAAQLLAQLISLGTLPQSIPYTPKLNIDYLDPTRVKPIAEYLDHALNLPRDGKFTQDHVESVKAFIEANYSPEIYEDGTYMNEDIYNRLMHTTIEDLENFHERGKEELRKMRAKDAKRVDVGEIGKEMEDIALNEDQNIVSKPYSPSIKEPIIERT